MDQSSLGKNHDGFAWCPSALHGEFFPYEKYPKGCVIRYILQIGLIIQTSFGQELDASSIEGRDYSTQHSGYGNG